MKIIILITSILRVWGQSSITRVHDDLITFGSCDTVALSEMGGMAAANTRGEVIEQLVTALSTKCLLPKATVKSSGLS